MSLFGEVTMSKPGIPDNAYTNVEFLNSPEARTIRILSEYLEPEARLASQKVNNTILFLGSSRVLPEDTSSSLCRYYWDAEELAFRLAKWAIPLTPKGKNFVICTGAGPGIMEAANRGAVRAGGRTIGMNISLPQEQRPNPYISPELAFVFHYFFLRKFWLISRARAVIAFPGGFGTLDELFETLTLIQTEKISRGEVVVLLYGEEYWRDILNFDKMSKRGTITTEDAALFTMSSDVGQAAAFLKQKLSAFIRNHKA
jgi:uncharacterized protein (TIGR00730 family)